MKTCNLPQLGSPSPLFSTRGVSRFGLLLAILMATSLASCARRQVRTQSGQEEISPTAVLEAVAAARTEAQTPEPAMDPVVATAPPVQITEQMGVSVKLSLAPVGPPQSRSVIHEGDYVVLRFEVTDTATKSPLANLSPAVWIDGRAGDATETCHDKIESFLTGGLSARAEYDLNTFFVLAMNDEPSITVVDPLFSYGGTRLLALIQLPSPGEDWVLNADESRLYVTLPLVNLVGVVDTTTWELVETIEVGVKPTRIRLQPDGKYLWVSCENLNPAGRKGRTYVIDTETLEVDGRLHLGEGRSDFAFSPDSRYAFASDAETASVFVVDVQSLSKTRTIAVGKSADGIVYSSASDCVYVVDGVGGEVVVIDGRSHEVIKRISDVPGLGAIKVAPDDRFVFVANAETDVVHVIDAAKNAIIQTADVGPGPDQIMFTLSLAYIRSKGSEIVLMIPLDHVGTGGPLSVVDFTGGHTPFGLAKMPSLADGIVAAPSGIAAIVANPIDKSIYYYREGMAAPMGEFINYGREPRAVLVVDRSLKETAPGVYTTSVQVTRSGTFDIAFLLDSPRVVQCFDLEVAPVPGDENPTRSKRFRVELIAGAREVTVGEPVQVRFEVRDSDTGQPLNDVRDLDVLAYSTSNWQSHIRATGVGDGFYEATFIPPRSGVYYVLCRVPSLGMGYRDVPFSTVTATEMPKTNEYERNVNP